MNWQKISAPQDGERIEINSDGSLAVPARPLIPWIEGDGIGVDISRATYPVLDAAVEKAYGGERRIAWVEIFAGEKAQEVYGEHLPQETFDAITHYRVAIKGPLTTPVGGGFRSLNVTLRQVLDLYACVRPVRYIPGVPSPMKNPEKVDAVIFRENTEDVYAGIEWESGSEEAGKIRSFLKEAFGVEIREDSGIGIKPISRTGTQRLVRMAIQHALTKNRRSVTLVHKGNIMKYTEGAFRDWGYELAAREFADSTITEDAFWKLDDPSSNTRMVVKDRIADAMFQQVLLRADEYDVIACPNLNGDYLSDALAAQVGGLGMAPGGNLGDEIALFEATHGTAPKYAGQDKVNPTSLILSGVMMLQHLGWDEAATLVERAIERTIGQKRVTYDLERQIEGATKVSCSEYGNAIIENL